MVVNLPGREVSGFEITTMDQHCQWCVLLPMVRVIEFSELRYGTYTCWCVSRFKRSTSQVNQNREMEECMKEPFVMLSNNLHRLTR